MIKRVVKMTFDESQIDAFMQVFNDSKNKIRNFEGCQHLELWQDKNQPNVIFTYSWWLEENDLEQYRQSDLFKTTWAKTKILFSDKPQAWTINTLQNLE